MAPKDAKVSITHGQLAILLVNFLGDIIRHGGPGDGYHNASKTLPEFLNELEDDVPKVTLTVAVLEDLLYGANMASEDGRFWHYKGDVSLDRFLDRTLGPLRIDGSRLFFDKEYNLIELEAPHTPTRREIISERKRGIRAKGD